MVEPDLEPPMVGDSGRGGRRVEIDVVGVVAALEVAQGEDFVPGPAVGADGDAVEVGSLFEGGAGRRVGFILQRASVQFELDAGAAFQVDCQRELVA
ncbi:MAG: hypothetical protein BWZ08_02837 [candidate division BRC1 bacterium ADurb.BinA292]|nr:MAG: hypothetical protein BWZ08_02837 [candidate division BRC1 bacterium ADurb.BinA292]